MSYFWRQISRSFSLFFCFYWFFGFSSNNGSCYNWKTMEAGIVWVCSVWVAVVGWMGASIVCCRNNWSNNLWYNNFWSYILNYWDSYWGKWSSSSGGIKVLLEFYLCSSNICSISYVWFGGSNISGICKIWLSGGYFSGIGEVWLSCGNSSIIGKVGFSGSYSFSVGKVQSSSLNWC